jgi:ribosomal protein S18 acetylase RimI-like enzyme
MNERELFEVDGAAVTLRREPWDCAQLSVETAKVEGLKATSDESAIAVVAKALAAARGRFALLASRIAATDLRGARALQANRFLHVDTVVNLALVPERFRAASHASGVTIRWATAADAAAIGALSADAFSDPSASFNRYLNDARLTREQVRQVYFVWGNTSVGGAAADATLTAWDGTALVGFLTLKNQNAEGTARVPLNAVATTHRGRGIYRALVVHAAEHVFKQGAKRLEVTTQLQQLAVQRTWLQLGGSLEGANYSFHLWP